MKGLLAILTWLIVLPLCGQPAGSLPPGSGGVPVQDSLPPNGLPLPPGTRALIEQLKLDIEQLHPLLGLANGQPDIPNNAPLENGLVPYVFPEPPPAHPVPNFGQNFSVNLGQNLSVNLGQNLSTLTTVTPPGVTALLPPNANLQVFPFPIAAPVPPPPGPAEATPPAPHMRLSQSDLILLHDLEILLQDAQADIQELLPRLDRVASKDAILNSSGGADPASVGQFAAGSAGVNNPNANGFATPVSSQSAQSPTNQLPRLPHPHP